MFVVRLCGTGYDNIYAVLAQDDWELGMPEGLAHWDGTRWRWIRRSKDSLTHDLKLADGHIFWLDSGGWIDQCDPHGDWHSRKAPYYDAPALEGHAGPRFGYTSMSIFGIDALGVVGYRGAFYILEGGSSRRIETNTSEDLYCIHGRPPDCFICGANGTLMRFDGTRVLDMAKHVYIYESYVCISECDDDSVFVCGVSEGGKQGSLLHLARGGEGGVTRSAAPLGIHSIAALSPNEVYCSSSDGVLIWDGRGFTPSLSRDVTAGQITKAGRTVILGSGPMGPGAILHSPPDWRRISLHVDESFINNI